MKGGRKPFRGREGGMKGGPLQLTNDVNLEECMQVFICMLP